MLGKRVPMLFGSAALMVVSGLAAVLLAGKPQIRILFWILCAVFFGAAVWLFLELMLLRKNTLHYLGCMNGMIGKTIQNAPEEMPIPVVMLDVRGMVVWCNPAFEKLAGPGDLLNLPLSEALPDFPLPENGGDSQLTFGETVFRVMRTDYVFKKAQMTLLTFIDITDGEYYRRKFLSSRPCVLLIMIDNYEDLFKGVRQSERASVLASLEILFDRMLDGTESVFCHLDEDRFLVLTEARNILAMEKAQFPLLDEARKITVRGQTNLTLSIGVGRSGKSLAQNEAFAQQSLDMALGRGGDQAAVWSEGGFDFYGGVSAGVERRSRAKIRVVAEQLEKLMQRSGHIYIMGHRSSDLDAVGASVGMAAFAAQYGVPHSIVLRKEGTLARLLTDRIEEEMPGILISPELARERIRETDLLVIVDTFSKDIVEDAELYRMARHVVVIDHHRQMVNYLDNTTLKLHDPHASSAAELVTGMIQCLSWRDQLPQFCAEALLSGIMLDTKNFVMQTGVHTFEAAAFLRGCGADPVAVKALFAESLDAYRRRAKLVSEAELHGRCAIACETEVLPDIRIIASQAADELLGVEGVAASFVIYDSGHQTCISARSLGQLNVQVIMERLGGGGHRLMAAAQRHDLSVQQMKSHLICVIDEMTAELPQTGTQV